MQVSIRGTDKLRTIVCQALFAWDTAMWNGDATIVDGKTTRSDFVAEYIRKHFEVLLRARTDT